MTETTPFDLQAELAELQAVQAEAIGWLPLGDGAYLHVGYTNEKDAAANEGDDVDVVDVVGVPDASMATMNVLLLAW